MKGDTGASTVGSAVVGASTVSEIVAAMDENGSIRRFGVLLTLIFGHSEDGRRKKAGPLWNVSHFSVS